MSRSDRTQRISSHPRGAFDRRGSLSTLRRHAWKTRLRQCTATNRAPSTQHPARLVSAARQMLRPSVRATTPAPALCLTTPSQYGEDIRPETNFVSDHITWANGIRGSLVCIELRDVLVFAAHRHLSKSSIAFLDDSEHDEVRRRNDVIDLPNLERFVVAQDKEGLFASACAKILAGQEISTQFAPVFPQIFGFDLAPSNGFGDAELPETWAKVVEIADPKNWGTEGIMDAIGQAITRHVELGKFYDYEISNLEEARAFLAHPILRQRICEITSLVNQHATRSVRIIFGDNDERFHSCMTLFSVAEPSESVFRSALDIFFGGAANDRTMTILEIQEELRQVGRCMWPPGTFHDLAVRTCEIYGFEEPTPLDWSRATVSESEWGSPREWVSAADFENRFRTIVQTCASGWINLQVLGIDDGVIHLAVDYVRGEPYEECRQALRTISINLIGPFIKQPWDVH